MLKHFTVSRTKKDTAGRVWKYCDSDGSWSHGPHTIGCGAKNKSKWMIWDGPSASRYEFGALTRAMEYCLDVLEDKGVSS